MITRRGLIGGMACLVTAPAIVRVENLMPVRQMQEMLFEPGLWRVIAAYPESSFGLNDIGVDIVSYYTFKARSVEGGIIGPCVVTPVPWLRVGDFIRLG